VTVRTDLQYADPSILADLAAVGCDVQVAADAR
jgi:hypothetical protein